MWFNYKTLKCYLKTLHNKKKLEHHLLKTSSLLDKKFKGYK